MTDIHEEGERIANETWKHPSGNYLWTDLVGAIQTGIHEERIRYHQSLEPVRKKLRDDLDSSVGTYAAQILRMIP